MSDERAYQPTNIKAPHGAKSTEITWADGHTGIYPNQILRGYCPCAHCQGHGGGIDYELVAIPNVVGGESNAHFELQDRGNLDRQPRCGCVDQERNLSGKCQRRRLGNIQGMTGWAG